MEPWGALSCSQELATGSYPESDESNISLRCSLIMSHVCLGLLSSGLPTKISCAFLISPMWVTSTVHFILFYLSILIIFVMSTNYAVSSTCVLRHRYLVRKFPQALCSQPKSSLLFFVRDQVLHFYKATVRVVNLYIEVRNFNWIAKCLEIQTFLVPGRDFSLVTDS